MARVFSPRIGRMRHSSINLTPHQGASSRRIRARRSFFVPTPALTTRRGGALGDLDAAAEMLAENLAIRRELGDKLGIGSALYGQGLVALKREDTDAACALLTQSLTIFQELENRRGIAHALNALAYLAVALARPERAARLFGAAEAVREAIGSPLPPNERPDYEQNLAIVRAALGEETFAAERAQGRALPREKALDYALECL